MWTDTGYWYTLEHKPYDLFYKHEVIESGLVSLVELAATINDWLGPDYKRWRVRTHKNSRIIEGLKLA